MSNEKIYDRAGTEPELQELLGDPLIQAVMRRDGVTPAELCLVIRTGRLRLAIEDCSAMMPPDGSRDWCCLADAGAAHYS
jgi:hypothetical protein